MPAPADEHNRPGALSRERPCPSCGHSFHVLRCGMDLDLGVTCPCRCPVPGIYPPTGG